MLTLFRTDLRTAFTRPQTYVLLGGFWLLWGLLLFVVPEGFNLADTGIASLSNAFELAPWLLALFIPLFGMRAMAQHHSSGTYDLLVTSPASPLRIVLNKFASTLVLSLIAILPIFIYAGVIASYSSSTLDWGVFWSSFTGLLLLITLLTAATHLAVQWIRNGIVVLVVAVIFCFVLVYATGSLDGFLFNGTPSYLPFLRGVLGLGTVFSFVLAIVGLLALALAGFHRMRASTLSRKRNTITPIALGAALLLLACFSHAYLGRLDLTQDQRYTLSETGKDILFKLDKPTSIQVMLDEELPAEFQTLQDETRFLLEDLQRENPAISFFFESPIADRNDQEVQQLASKLAASGITAVQATTRDEGEVKQQLVFPYLVIEQGKQGTVVPLLVNQNGSTPEQRVTQSIQQLEYNLLNGLQKVTGARKPAIANLRGKGQLPDINMSDLLLELREYYRIGAYNLDSVPANLGQAIQQLSAYDLIIDAKPTEPYTETEKVLIDQYLMQGGKMLWTMDAVAMETDSLYNPTGKAFALSRDLNLTDQLFAYGARLENGLVQDLRSAPIVVAREEGRNTQYQPFFWPYYVLPGVNPNHPITSSIEPPRLEYASVIDTVASPVDKTLLLASSNRTRIAALPETISLNSLSNEPDAAQFVGGRKALGLLMEGEFASAYAGRVAPQNYKVQEKSTPDAKLLIVADGDLLKNSVERGRPAALGFDRYTGITHGNKDFAVNAIRYMTGSENLLNLRSKPISVNFINQAAMFDDRVLIWIFALVLPLLILVGTYLLVRTWYRNAYQNPIA